MTEPGDEPDTSETAGEGEGVSDDQLPDDLTPGDDNPLAEGLEDGETVEGLMDGGKPAEQDTDSGDSSDSGDSEDEDAE